MSPRRSCAAFIAVAAVWTASAVAAGTASSSLEQTPKAPDAAEVARKAVLLPEAPGRTATLRICGTECHTAETFSGRFTSRDDWEITVDDMIGRGAQMTDEEYTEVLNYLVGQFPERYDVNTQTAAALQSRLVFTAAEAAAIVAYRDAHGAFGSVEDLKKVSGVTPEKIDAVRRKLRFGPKAAPPAQ